ncbi:polysaccharide pyruvyl transferase family protein [Flavobacterium soli]|uniref:polysaccharide pyruvyl transferase family protein n=1 Tax=Flavobacterium soli TaxID=344881 RepID=UPI00040E5FE8|nr:polysaccharide pyruvyl transferase family protein [Flavobacterium soli]
MKKLLKTAIFFLRNQTVRGKDFWCKLLQYKLTSKPLIYWYSRVDFENEALENFGDIVTPYIVKKLTGLSPVLFRPSDKLSKYCKHYIMVGSIIGDARTKSTVWGSGIIKQDQYIRGGNFLAVRGPRTALRIRELGFKEPNVYGDPALLLPLLYKPNSSSKRYKIGIIPHYIDYIEVQNLLSRSSFNDMKVINLLNNNVENVIEQIILCDKIISTSLHGIIVANAYEIPAMWWKFSDKLSGDDIKFHDYFESVEKFDLTPIYGKNIEDVIYSSDYFIPKKELVLKLQKGLLASFPIKNATYKENILKYESLRM